MPLHGAHGVPMRVRVLLACAANSAPAAEPYCAVVTT
jgi:hypothetical protein